LAARKATDTIPIVVTYGDPVRLGLVASLAHPGGNVTGLSAFPSELGAKQLEVLKEAFPKVSRVTVLWWEGNSPEVDSMKVAAARLGLTLHLRELREAADVEAALAGTKAERTQALLVVRNPFTATHRVRIAEFAASHHLPAIYGDRQFIEAGGLMSYGVSIPDLWARAAVYVDKILKGAPPAMIPVEGPTRFALVVNTTAAQAGQLSIAQSVLSRADEIIR
jgi:putative ABC transport system substrate-binding protein